MIYGRDKYVYYVYLGVETQENKIIIIIIMYTQPNTTMYFLPYWLQVSAIAAIIRPKKEENKKLKGDKKVKFVLFGS